ncbi:hypothetical protein [uncultured Nostoc sp.]|uniref:hypothetical protein n=1 Tax=uncultured Nostoc sp. TaxID=340711 RepID=UPI0035CB600D
MHYSKSIGALSGPTIATTLLSLGMNWRQVYWVLASIVSLLIVSVLGAMIYRYTPMTLRVSTSTNTTALENLGRSLQNPVVVLTGLLLLVSIGIEACIV